MKKIAFVLIALMSTSAMLFASGRQSNQAAPSSTGAASGSGTTIRWAFWGNSTRIELTQRAIDLYQSQNPGVQIHAEPYDGNSSELQTVMTQIAGGNAPDIIQMGGNWPDLVSQALPLESYAGTLLDTQNIDQGALDMVSQNGRLYGISVGNTYLGLVYNKGMLQRAGAPLPKHNMSYDELRAYLMSIKPLLPEGVYPMMDVGFTSQSETYFGHYLRTRGLVSYNAAAKSTQVTAAVIKDYLDMFADYRANGLIPPAEIAAQFAEANSDSSALVAGRVALTFLAASQLSGFEASMTDELDLTTMPGANAQNKAHWAQLSQVMMVNKDSKNPQEAVKFINWIVTSPDAGRILGTNRGISASSTYRAGVQANPTDAKILVLAEAIGSFLSPESDHFPNDAELVSQEFLIYQSVYFDQFDTAQGAQRLYDERLRLMNK
jgi:multiple sugar transport system substrate-binding protein